jgi:hypothetical protein
MNRSLAQIMAMGAAMAGKGISGGPVNKKMEFVRAGGSSKHGQGQMTKGTQPKRYKQKQIGARKFFRKYA